MVGIVFFRLDFGVLPSPAPTGTQTRSSNPRLDQEIGEINSGAWGEGAQGAARTCISSD
jgi:hypothetical protein